MLSPVIVPAAWCRILFTGEVVLIRSALAAIGRIPGGPPVTFPLEGHALDGVLDPFGDAKGGYVVTVRNDPRRAASMEDVYQYAVLVRDHVLSRLASHGVTAVLHYKASGSHEEFYEWLAPSEEEAQKARV